MLTVATGSLVIGPLPTYAAIGTWAPVILLRARMMQGFAHGGESAATAYTYVGKISESFPTHLRTESIGFAYKFSVAVFGGTAPYLNQLLLSWDLGWVFGVYIVALAALTGLACFFMKETRGVRLEDV